MTRARAGAPGSRQRSPAGRRERSRRRPRGGLSLQPTPEGVRADDRDAEEHLGVVQTAIGGAVTSEYSGLHRRTRPVMVIHDQSLNSVWPWSWIDRKSTRLNSS